MTVKNTPKSWFRRAVEAPNVVLLDTAAGHRPALLFEEPREIITTRDPAGVPECLARLDEARADGRFVAGYLNYEAAGFYFPVAHAEPAAASGPLLWFGVYGAPRRLDPAARAEQARLFRDGHDSDYSFKRAGRTGAETRERFLRDVGRIKEHLAAGDCYQINYTLESDFLFSGDAFGLYEALRAQQPAGYSAFIRNEYGCVLSLSPELFFRLESESEREAGGERDADAGDTFVIEARPVKGTAPRDRDPHGDRRLRESLALDEKTRAENVMIVDLLRNDLGVHAERVDTPRLFELETLPTLHQMFSVVRARIQGARARRLFSDILPALFPCGSITGAPKIAAGRIIASLEQRRRGVYTGAIGLAGPASRGASSWPAAEFNVAIRTLEIDVSGHARFGSGCGIVWDSVPELEWEEFRLKRAFLVPTLDEFRLIETLRVEPGDRVLLAALHWSRLLRAAAHFRIPGPRSSDVRSRVSEYLAEFRRGGFAGPVRLRLTLDRRGRLELTASELPDEFGRAGVSELRLLVSPRRVWSGDPFRPWKTSERRMYDEEFRRARELGYDDALFLNEREEIVETAIGNLLARSSDGSGGATWLTPRPESGNLPGVYLRSLEAARPGRIRRVKMKLQDLASAKHVYVLNSVRGLRRVGQIDAAGERVYLGD